MRVLHVINSLAGSGGAEHGLVRETTRFGEDVEQAVVRLFSPDQLEAVLEREGIQTISLGLDSGNSGWNWPGGALRLRRVIGQFEPDIVHSSLASANLVAQLAGGRASLPVLSTFTLSGDPALMRQYQPGAHLWRAELLRRVERLAARRDHVFFRALTQDAKATNCAAAALDPDRVTVIPRGVPMPDRSSPTPTRSELGLPPTGTLILNVGRQTRQKGHGDLVEAFREVQASVPAHLVILGREGDGTEPLMTSLDRAGVRDHVTIIPYTDSPYDYYQAADLFVFSSHMEGLGTAVLEAMACGLPVVAYDIPPVREITGGTLATLVPLGDVSALASAIQESIDTGDALASRTESARSHVAANYSLDAIAQRLESLLTDLASQGAHSVRGR